MPDLDVARLVVALRRFDLLVPIGDTDEDGRAVFAPLGRTRSNDPLRRGDFTRRLRTGILPRQHDARFAFVILALDGAERGEIGRVLAPDQRAEHGVAGIEHAQRAGRGIEELDGVTFAPIDADGHREARSLVLPGVSGDVAESGVGAGLEITHGQRCADRFGAVARSGARTRTSATTTSAPARWCLGFAVARGRI